MPSSHEHLPPGLTHLNLFSAEEDHFLQTPPDASDILIGADLPSQAHAHAHAHTHAHAHAHAATLSEAAAHAALGPVHPAHVAPEHAPPVPLAEPPSREEDPAALVRQRAARRHDPSALEVTALALRAENERLYKMIAALEARPARPALATPAATGTTTAAAAAAAAADTSQDMSQDIPSDMPQDIPQDIPQDMPQGIDLLPHGTLRELASAAVSEAALASLNFESFSQLEEHPDSGAMHAHLHAPGVLDMAVVDAGALLPEPLAHDFLHSLVFRVLPVPSAPGEGAPDSDPFRATRLAIEADIATTRAQIAMSESEIAALKANGGGAAAAEGTGAAAQHRPRPELEAQISKNMAAALALEQQAGVLRDVAARLEQSVEGVRSELKMREAELAVLVIEDDGDGNGDGDGDGDGDGRTLDAQRALVDVRMFLESLLKIWKEKGILPPPPLPAVSLLPRSDNVIQPPPSALPKKRGRPSRSSQKPSVVPQALAHLVPDEAAVAARQAEAPIRRKGIKRNKTELERERQREEEESELLRNLVGIGVWGREEGFAEPVE